MRTRYPAELEQPGLLRDGRSVFIRPVRAADEEAVLDFARRLSRRTLVQRLLGPVPRFHRELLRQFVDVDYADHLALAAFLNIDDLLNLLPSGSRLRLHVAEGMPHADLSFSSGNSSRRHCRSQGPSCRFRRGAQAHEDRALLGDKRQAAAGATVQR